MLKDSSKPEKFGPLSALVVTFLAYLGSQLVAGLAIGLYINLSGKGANDAVNFLSETTSGQFIFMAAVQLATLGILYWLIRTRNITLASIGLGRGPKFSDFSSSIIYFVGYFVALAFIMSLVDKVLPAVDINQEQQTGFESAQGFWPLLMVFVSLVVLPPIVEEIMIRGFLYSGLRKKFTKVIAAFIASFLFAIAHLQLGSGASPLYAAAIDTFFLSIVLIVLRERTGSLWAGIFVHALKNGLAFLALFVFNVR